MWFMQRVLYTCDPGSIPGTPIRKSKMICKNCEREFTGRKRLHCSKKCRNAYKSRRYYERHGKGKGICGQCNKPYKKSRYEQKYCSNKCSGLSKKKFLSIPDCLEDASRKLDKTIGYVRVYCPMHKEANTWGYVYEHRLIAEGMLGRELQKDEIVHHKNQKRWDNRPENLEVMNKHDHHPFL